MKMMKTLVATTLLAATAVAQADMSANIGVVSEYFYRGFSQGESASASGGVDFEHESGLYAGIWGADVEDGIEYDLYGGYGGSVGDFSYGIGYTGYFYTEDSFDDTYKEFNLTAGYGPISVEHSIGEWDGEGGMDYTFTAITGEYNGFYGTYGSFGDEFDGDYLEVGYGTEVGGFDVGIAVIKYDSDIGGDGDDGSTSVVLSLGKTFDL